MAAAKKLTFLSAIFFLVFSTLFAWTETGLTPSEDNSQYGMNDSFATAGAIPNYQYSQDGYGYIAAANDQDYFTFTIPASDDYIDHDFLKIQFTAPAGNNDYSLQIYSDNLGSWVNVNRVDAYNGGTSTAYVDISMYHGVSHNYALQVSSCNNCGTSFSTSSPYIINMSVISSGTISGTVNLIGAGASGLSGVNVSGQTNGQYLGGSNTDPSGNYSVRVPAGIPITGLQAFRGWYFGCANDWAYGVTTYILPSAITVSSPGENHAGNNFKVYKEGVLSGTISAALNVDLELLTPYNSNTGGSNSNSKFNINGPYEIHNLPPGTYSVWVQPHAGYGSGQAVSFTPNVNIIDGFNTTVNYNIGSGNSVSGTFNPPAGGNTSVQVYMPGHLGGGLSDWDPFSRYFRVNVSGNAYTIQGLPDGVYDITASGNGPSFWDPQNSVTVNGGSATVDFSGPAPDTSIAGTVIDNTSAVGLTNVAVLAVAAGSADIIGKDIRGYIGMCDNSGNFSITVPSGTQTYDLVGLTGINSNGNPVFMAWAYDVVTGTANVSMAINAGISVSGGMYFNSQTIDTYQTGGQVELMRETSPGTYKFYSMGLGNNNSAFFNTGSYLESNATPYHVKMRAKSTWFADTDVDIFPSVTSLINQNFNFSVDPARDIYRPSAGNLDPAQNGVLVNPAGTLYTEVSDMGLGSGISGVTILSDGAPVTGLTYSGNSTDRAYSFTLPSAQRTPGTSHSITMMITDQHGNIFNLNNSSWDISIATNTPVGTLTFTPTSTPSATATVTPLTCNISGTITLPAISTGKQWVVIIDTDLNGGNGYTAMTTGITTGTNTIPYTINAAAGTYYVYGFVDELGAGLSGGPQPGDYFAIYGGTYPASMPSSPNVSYSCPGGGVFDMTAVVMSAPSTPTITPTINGCSISGTVTLPFVSTGKNWYVIVDNDTNGGNGWVNATSGTTNGTNQFTYNVAVPNGTYYVYTVVDELNTGMPSGPQPGDYVGFFGTLWPAVPGSPNVTVVCPGGGVFDITAALMPTPSPTNTFTTTPTYTVTITPGGPTFTFTATPVYAWSEMSLIPQELPGSTGNNDSFGSADVIPGGQVYQLGAGYISSSNDNDYYRFTIPASDNTGNHNVLRVQLSVPQGGNNLYYQCSVYEFTGTWNNLSGSTNGTSYSDISQWSGASHDFAIQVRGGNNSYSTTAPYNIKIDIIDSGTISGKITLVGVKASGYTNVRVSVWSSGNYLSSMNVDAAGNYQLRVPVGLPVTAISADRFWYLGAPADWAYGPTTYSPPAPLTVAGAGLNIGGVNFNVYKEGVMKGNISSLGKNVDIYLQDPYTGHYSQIGNSGYVSNTMTTYEMHNLAAGTYMAYAQPNLGYGSGLAISAVANVVIRDGFTTNLDMALSAGHTVTGSFNPPATGGESVSVYKSGTNKMGYDPYQNYYRVNVTGNSYTIQNLPDGTYDFQASSGGPGKWYTAQNVNVSSDTTVNFSGPSATAFIAGTVVDYTGTLNLSQAAVFAVVSGTADVIGTNVIGFAAACDVLGNFSLPVDGSVKYYDLLVVTSMNTNGPPIFGGRAYDVVTGTANVLMGIDTGITVSGSVKFSSNPVSQYFGNNGGNAGVEIMKDMGGGNYKLFDYCQGTDNYTSGPYLPPSGTPYAIRIRSKEPYMLDQDIDTLLGTNPLANQDFNMAVDPAQDKAVPYSGELVPEQNGVLTGSGDTIYATLGDNIFSSGFTSVQITSDGTAVAGLSYAGVSNGRRYSFTLPIAQKIPGTAHNIAITAQDSAGNVYSTGGTWVISIATITPTITNSPPWTSTATPTVTQTFTVTPTWSVSPVASATATPSITPTFTATATGSDSPTSTDTPTTFVTKTPSPSRTITQTATPTDTATITPTATATPSYTPTDTSTFTMTATQSFTMTATKTATPTSSSTPTFTPTSTPTSTMTRTFTPTFTASSTATSTKTCTPTYSVTPTITDSPTDTPTYTVTPTVTETMFVTATLTSTETPVPTQTPSFLAKAYPQPAGGSITFAYRLSKAGKVSVNVYNLGGLPVAVLDAGVGATGDNTSAFDISALSPGVYFYIIKCDTGDKFRVNKFVVER